MPATLLSWSSFPGQGSMRDSLTPSQEAPILFPGRLPEGTGPGGLGVTWASCSATRTLSTAHEIQTDAD